MIVLDDNSEEEPLKKKPKITKDSKEPKLVTKKDEAKKPLESSKISVPSGENGNSTSKPAQPPSSLVSFFRTFDAKAKPSEKAPFHSKSEDGRELRNNGDNPKKKKQTNETSFDKNLSKLLEMGFTIEVFIILCSTYTQKSKLALESTKNFDEAVSFLLKGKATLGITTNYIFYLPESNHNCF